MILGRLGAKQDGPTTAATNSSTVDADRRLICWFSVGPAERRGHLADPECEAALLGLDQRAR